MEKVNCGTLLQLINDKRSSNEKTLDVEAIASIMRDIF